MTIPIKQNNYWGGTENLFLKGPIPRNWVLHAHKAGSGSGLVVGLEIWRRLDVSKTKSIPVPYRVFARELDISKASVKRALIALEEKKLITVDRQRGRAPLVEIPERLQWNVHFRKNLTKQSWGH